MTNVEIWFVQIIQVWNNRGVIGYTVLVYNFKVSMVQGVHLSSNSLLLYLQHV